MDTFCAMFLIMSLMVFQLANAEPDNRCSHDVDGIDTLYECDFTRRCRDLNHPKQYGEFRDIDGDRFNCYYGFTPFCILEVPDDVKDREAFCQERLQDSKLVTEDDKHTCEQDLAPIS